MNIDQQVWQQFLQENWFIIVVAIVAIIIIMKIVKTMLKWALVAAIVIGIVVYSGYTLDDLKQVGTKITAEAKDQAIKAMVGEATEAKYKDNGDGSYTITTPTLKLTGVPNSGKIEVSLKGVSLGTWKMEGAVRELVVKARAAAK